MRDRVADDERVPQPTSARSLCGLLAMLVAVAAVYWPPTIPAGWRQFGADFLQLHVRRMQFARDALLGPSHTLPAWYPRELLGTPFWANVQNFPFVPSRLLVLFTLDPNGPWTYAIAVTLSAALAALFTFAYCRRLGLGVVASAAAGWTFAACGFYASRIAAGHLPLLEAYGSLPLLLWSVEALVQSHARHACGRAIAGRSIALAVATMFTLLVGHPQLSIYALIASGTYLLWRFAAPRDDAGTATGADVVRPSRLRGAIVSAMTMALGVGCASFALVPMAMLTARSTRILPLAAPDNDLAMPPARLFAWLLPSIDGYPPVLAHDPSEFFHNYNSPAYFWDTNTYAGWLPWLAIVGLWVVGVRPSLRRGSPTMFLVAMSVLAVLLSLPWWQQVTHLIPGTYLRSPARLVYVTELGLAIGLAFAIDRVLRQPLTPYAPAIVAAALLVHAIDLGAHDRRYILAFPSDDHYDPARLPTVGADVGDARVAIDYELSIGANRRADDVGFFDSLMLARSYRLVLDLAGAIPGLNVQTLSGSQLRPRALKALGVRTVLTPDVRTDLPQERTIGPFHEYRVDAPAPRAEYFREDRLRYLGAPAIHVALRDPDADVAYTLMLPTAARPAASIAAEPGDQESTTLDYRRPDADQIRCAVTTNRSGVLRVIESFDRGWTATVDGAAAPIYPALDGLLAVRVPPGHHEVAFVYRTPGATLGIGLSLLSALGVALVATVGARPRGARNASVVT